MFRYSPNENSDHYSVDERLQPTYQIRHRSPMKEPESGVEHKRNRDVMAININVENQDSEGKKNKKDMDLQRRGL